MSMEVETMDGRGYGWRVGDMGRAEDMDRVGIWYTL